MKEIVSISGNATPIDNVNNNSIVGILFDNVHKTVVLPNHDGTFHSVKGVDREVFPENKWTRPTIREYIENARDNQGAKAYIFDSWAELFTWMGAE